MADPRYHTEMTGVSRFIPTFSHLEEALAAEPGAVIEPMRPRQSPTGQHTPFSRETTPGIRA